MRQRLNSSYNSPVVVPVCIKQHSLLKKSRLIEIIHSNLGLRWIWQYRSMRRRKQKNNITPHHNIRTKRQDVDVLYVNMIEAGSVTVVDA